MPQRETAFRYLKRNHSNALPRYIIVYDTETLPKPDDSEGKRKTHSFRLGVAITTRLVGLKPTGTKRHEIKTKEEFWELCDKYSAANYTTWIVCHNALFDMVISGLPEMFETAQLVVEWPRSVRQREDNNTDNVHQQTICIIDSPPTIIACKLSRTGGRIVIVDTLNWFPCSLRVLGDAVSLPKLELPQFSATDKEWYHYCGIDAEITFRAFTQLIQWNRDNDMGMFRYTAASQAMSAYRHRFMNIPICIHDNLDAKKLERQGYFGGRTEVFKLGTITQTVHQYDVNSLFPSVMQCGLFPCQLDQIEFADEYSDTLPEIDYRRSLAQVTIDTPLPTYPFRTKDHVLFPVGRFNTVLCGEELYDAWTTGRIKAIKSWAEYKTDLIFADWVNELWQMRIGYRREGNKLYDEYTKRLLNSLYGKFGQRSPSWVNVSKQRATTPWSQWAEVNMLTGEREMFRSFGYQVQQWKEREEISGTFVAIAAFVTSAARMRMNDIRSAAGKQNVFYQGVDSLVVTNEGKRRLTSVGLIDEFELGKLRHQLTTDTGSIVGCSNYKLGSRRVLSGCTIDSEADDIATMQQHSFSAASYLFTGKAIDTVKEEWLPYQLTGAYHKGTIQSDGWIGPPIIGSPVDSSIGGAIPGDAASSATDETITE